MKVKRESDVAQSCPTLSDPMDCSLPGSSVHGIFQARVLEWGAIAFFIDWYIEVAERGNDRVTLLKETNFPYSSAGKDQRAMQEIQESWFPSPHQDPLKEVIGKKRCTAWELQVYLGQNEDCSPGGSISDSSERLLQSRSGRKSIYKVLVKGEFNTMKHSFYKNFFFSFSFFFFFFKSGGSDVTMTDSVLL